VLLLSKERKLQQYTKHVYLSSINHANERHHSQFQTGLLSAGEVTYRRYNKTDGMVGGQYMQDDSAGDAGLKGQARK
jgi:hypothetical protein